MNSTRAGGKGHAEDSHNDPAGTVHNPPLQNKEDSLEGNTRGHKQEDLDNELRRNQESAGHLGVRKKGIHSNHAAEGPAAIVHMMGNNDGGASGRHMGPWAYGRSHGEGGTGNRTDPGDGDGTENRHDSVLQNGASSVAWEGEGA